MNLDKARVLLSKLIIKDRDLNVSVPFSFNPNQIKTHEIMKKAYEKHKWLRLIFLKARRVGISSLMDAFLFTHCLARPQAHAEIVAHLKEVSEKGLFRVPKDLGEALNAKADCCDVRTRDIIFHHTSGDSRLDIATAGSVGGGRGLTLTALHLSEAAQYPGANSFLGILPAVSKAPDTIIAVESTAFGRVGLGEPFYKFWLSANRKGREWNGYTPIFLSWLDDPGCQSDPEQAFDAPATDLERELMGKPFNATKRQIAWMRLVLEGECDASEAMFSQEYPWEPSVAFVSTGDPAFTPQELTYARQTIKEPELKGHLERSSGKPVFVEDRRGKLLVWENPKDKCSYYIGVDCARGMEQETGRATGDFAAYVVLNGTTGDVVARFSDWVNPEVIAEDVDKIGRWYNNAMVNVELTGNLGLWAQKILRDQLYYPNLYVWRGKDDSRMGKAKSGSLGWETTSRTRDLLLSTFRGKLREGMKRIPGGLDVHDREIVEQMDNCSMSAGMRWEIQHGHDDILIAVFLAVISCAQYPPSNIANYKGNYLETKEMQHASAAAALKPQASLEHALRADLNFIMRNDKQRNRNVLGRL